MFEPWEPTNQDAFTDWAQKMHREAFQRRRMLNSPDVLVYQTTQGVFVRPKPCECTSQVIEIIRYEDEFDFRITWEFQSGGGSDPRITELVNAESFSIPRPHDHNIQKFYWNNSGVRITRKIKYPYYIAQTKSTLTPVHEGSIIAFGVPPVDLTKSIGPLFAFGSELGYNDATDPGFDYASVQGLWADDIPGLENPIVDTFAPQQMPTDGVEHYFGGRLMSRIVDNAFTAALGKTAKQLRQELIEPGAKLTVEGYVRRSAGLSSV